MAHMMTFLRFEITNAPSEEFPRWRSLRKLMRYPP